MTVRVLLLLWISLFVGMNTVEAGIVLEFNNASVITIDDYDIASPYPSTINVSGVTGSILNIQVLLNGLSHSFPDDLAAVVVSPSNKATLLFSGPGGFEDANNLNFLFDDGAADTLPENGVLSGGTYRPGLDQWGDDFPAPGPGTTYAGSFSHWLADNPNGAWKLFVLDGSPSDAGSISGGWGLRIEVAAVPEPSSFALILFCGSVVAAGRWSWTLVSARWSKA